MIKGKIILVPFPFDDLSSAKVRPAVCLTEEIGPHHQVIIAFITSQVPSNLLATDLVLSAQHPDFAATGLHRSSVLRLHRLVTISTSVIRRELGTLSPELLTEMTAKLRLLFAISLV